MCCQLFFENLESATKFIKLINKIDMKYTAVLPSILLTPQFSRLYTQLILKEFLKINHYL